MAATNALQDALHVEGGGDGPLEIPDWNIEQMMTARDALNTLAKLGISNAGGLGSKDEVDPIKHLIFSAAGWGGMPLKNTYGDLGSVDNNDGTPHVVTAKDVPVRAFWSVIVYDADTGRPRVCFAEVEAWLRSTRVAATRHAEARVAEVLRREGQAAPQRITAPGVASEGGT